MFITSNNAIGKGGFMPAANKGYLLTATGEPPITLTKTLKREPESIIITGADGGVGDVASVAEGYTRLQYIQSNGTQYIDTGYVPTGDFAFEVMFRDDVVSGSLYFMGNRESSSDNSFSFGVGGSVQSQNIQVVAFNAATPNRYRKSGYIYRVRSEATSSMTGTSTIECLTTGEIFSGEQTRYSLNSTSVKVFAYMEGQLNAGSSLYYLKIWQNGELVHSFIPAQRDSDDELGLYDTVTGDFKTNAGTGSFTGGNPVYAIPIAYNTRSDNLFKQRTGVIRYNVNEVTITDTSVSFKTAENGTCHVLGKIPVTEGKTYTFYTNKPPKSGQVAIYKDSYPAGNLIISGTVSGYEYTVPSGTDTIVVRVYSFGGTTANTTIKSTGIAIYTYSPKSVYIYSDASLDDGDSLTVTPKSKAATRTSGGTDTIVSDYQDWEQDFKIPKADSVIVTADTTVAPSNIEIQYLSRAKTAESGTRALPSEVTYDEEPILYDDAETDSLDEAEPNDPDPYPLIER